MPTGIDLRAITPDDHALLLAIYGSTRSVELARVPWSDEQKAAFIEQQFNAQHAHYMREFGEAQFDIVLREGEPVGRLYVDRRDDAIHILDIAVLAEFQQQGIGSGLLKALVAEATAKDLPVTLYVEVGNPVRELYEKLGFRVIAEEGIHHLMEWERTASTIDAKQIEATH